jgi:DeoR family transcriptional regulator of aga operon
MMLGDMTKTKQRRLLREERHRQILQMLEESGRVTVEELIDVLSVSAVTARADLDALAEAGALVRSHGGGVKRVDPLVDYPVAIKETLHKQEKVRIGAAAAALIKPDQTIILDSGTTTAEIAREIRKQQMRITVVTNALNIAGELANAPKVQVVMLGGLMRKPSGSMVGPQAEASLKALSADHLFLGVDAIDAKIGICTPDILEAQLNELMISVSREVTAVADFSKFQRRSLSVISPVERLSRLITDTQTDAKAISELRSRGVEVVVV